MSASLKGQCYVEHGGKFLDILRGQVLSIRKLLSGLEGKFEVWRADLRSLGRFEAWRTELGAKG